MLLFHTHLQADVRDLVLGCGAGELHGKVKVVGFAGAGNAFLHRVVLHQQLHRRLAAHMHGPGIVVLWGTKAEEVK